MKKCILTALLIFTYGLLNISLADEPFDIKNINRLSYYGKTETGVYGSIMDDRHSGKMYWTSSRPDGHAPIGVMGDHTHSKGEFMFSYRYMYMNMDGNLDGTTELTTSEITSATGNYKYMISPEKMTMQMHMLGVMYAATDKLTLMAMLPYVMKSMDHITRSGVTFTTDASGIGDVSLTGLYRLMNKDRNAIHANLGLSFPTGSIDEMDVTPASSPNETILPYPMQLGSGSFGITPGITYLGQTDCWSWGAQASGTFYAGDNNRDYKLGNQYNVTAWGAYILTRWLSASLRVNSTVVQNISGADSTLNPAMVPTADPNLRGGKRIDVNLGFNVYSFEGSLKGLRFAVEGGLPIYQNLDGPQLKTSWSIVTGLQYAFH